MDDFTKVVRLGTIDIGGWCSVYCKIKFKDGELSITGVEGPLRSGNALGGCGQIVMCLKADEINPAPGWTPAKIQQFLKIWDRWHLNHMKAGTPKQEAAIALRTRKIAKAGGDINENPHGYAYKAGYSSHYEMACDWLKQVDLYEDNGYRYGTAWLKEQVPDRVLKFLRGLPDTDIQPAWV